MGMGVKQEKASDQNDGRLVSTHEAPIWLRWFLKGADVPGASKVRRGPHGGSRKHGLPFPLSVWRQEFVE